MISVVLVVRKSPKSLLNLLRMLILPKRRRSPLRKRLLSLHLRRAPKKSQSKSPRKLLRKKKLKKLRFPRIRKRKRLKRSKLFRSPLLRALRKVSPKRRSLLTVLNRASLSLRIVLLLKKKSNQSSSQSRLTLQLRLIRITTDNSPCSNSRDLMVTNRPMRFSLDNSISMLKNKTLRTSSKIVEMYLLLSSSEMMMEDLKEEDLLSLAMKMLSRRLWNSKEKNSWEDQSKSKSQEKEKITNRLRDLTIDSKVESQVKSLRVSS